MEAVKTTSVWERSKSKTVSYFWGDFQGHHKALKNIGVVLPKISPFNSPFCLIQKLNGSWTVTVHYCKPNKVVTLLTAAVPNVVCHY
jgi:hypothetical protein